MKTAVIAATLLIVPTRALSTSIYVPDDHATIQAAINATVEGDTVIVRPGTYAENITCAKDILVRSEGGPRVTVIDGGQIGTVLEFNNPALVNAVLDGFTITNGSASAGGGLLCMGGNPTVVNCIISDNRASSYGGGVWIALGSPTIADCLFIRNSTGGEGGGLLAEGSGASVVNSAFIGNSAAWGAGLFIETYEMAVQGCQFIENVATAQGGGARIGLYRSATMDNCTFWGNIASQYGGGLSMDEGSDPVLRNCTLYGNSAGTNGGGMIITDYCRPRVTNCILWNNSPNEIYNSWWGNWEEVSYTCIKGGYTGLQNIDLDPLVVDPPGGDLHLTWDSPCRDSGNNAAVVESDDFEGDPRIHEGTVDMGADEFHPHLYHVGEVLPGSTVAIKIVGNPGTAPVTLALGSGIQDPPQPTPYGDLHLILPPQWQTRLGTIPANGVLVNTGLLPATWQTGEEYPFQALLGPQMPGVGSVLTNLRVLEVE